MNLQPPSFFEVSSPRGDAERSVLAKWREELARMNRENKILRQRLEAYTSPLRPPPSLSPLLTSATCTPHLPPLTSDLLHVEERLQSRLRLLESEKKEASLQVLDLEKTLAIHKKEYHKRVENLRAEHEEVLCKMESDRQRLSVEYRTYQEEKERQVRLLTAEISMQREQCSTQTNKLLAKNTELEYKLTTLECDKREVIQSLEGELASVSQSLVQNREETNTHLTSLTAQVAAHCQKVKTLEAYLGGEMPEIQAHGMTWKEDRQLLCSEIKNKAHQVQRLESENYLLNVRLNSMSEILTLQEADITKGYDNDKDKVQSLLKKWREKVFVLMIQKKLQEIEDTKCRAEVQRKESSLVEKLEELEREQAMAAHALSDKNAELQLKATKIKEVEVKLDRAKAVTNSLHRQLRSKSSTCSRISNSIRCIAQLQAGFKATFYQALTHLANYQHRVTFAVKRVQSLKATLSCHYALLRNQVSKKVDAECQVCGGPDEQEYGISSLTRGQLEMELQTLSRERENLIGQLGDSTDAFQKQLKSLKDKSLAESRELEHRLDESRTESASLQQNLTELLSKFESSEEERGKVTKVTQELTKELRELKGSVESRIESELTKQKQKSREELFEMEKLLNVARREHSKAIVQLQRLTRQVTLDKERTTEAAEMDRAKLERELTDSKKQLQSVQVQRNLLITTLRQEEGSDPKSLHESPRIQGHQNSPTKCIRQSATVTQGAIFERPTVGCGLERQGGAGPSDPGQGVGMQSCLEDSHQQEDIRDVLKDLQMLSASLLSMEPDPGIGRNKNT